MSNHVHVPDRAALSEASELIERLGPYAGSEAARRADDSRARGNLLHFCRWRQIERAVAMLGRQSGGTLH